MGYGIGALLALVVFWFARLSGFDRDRAFYPTVVIVVALYYVLFAVIGRDPLVLIIEAIIMTAFAAVAVIGFKSNMWLVAAALAGHGVMDIFHQQVVPNAGVPAWWPAFCMAYDVAAAAGLAWLLRRSPVRP